MTSLSPMYLAPSCLAGWINREQQRLIEYLQAENRVLRELAGTKHPKFTNEQRRLFAEKAKAAGRRVLTTIETIVTPDSLLRWHRQLIAQKWTFLRKSPGTPETSPEITDLIVKLARENPAAGYDRLAGMLANLGYALSANTVKAILKDHGLEPAPRRSRNTSWRDFLRAHWETLAACDFFTTEVWTTGGLVTFYVLFVIEIATRRLQIAGITTSPGSAWMQQVARNLTDYQEGFLKGKTHLLTDRDTMFTQEFRDILKTAGVEPVRLPPRSPNLNAHAERFVRTIKEECLDKMIFFGEKMLQYAIRQFVEHYHAERNHQGLGNQIIQPDSSVGTTTGEIVCRERLGGLLKYHHRRAA